MENEPNSMRRIPAIRFTLLNYGNFLWENFTEFALPNIITYLIKIAHLHCLLMSSIPNRLENICMNRICSASGDILGSILGNCCSGWPARRSLLQIG